MRREMCEEEYVELLEELAYHVAVIKYLTKQFEDTGWSYPLAIDTTSKTAEIHMMPSTIFKKLKYASAAKDMVTERGKEKQLKIGKNTFFAVEEWNSEKKEGDNESTN